MREENHDRPDASTQSIPSSVDPDASRNEAAGTPLEGLDALAKADPLARLEAARNSSDEPSSGYETGSPQSRLVEIEKQAQIVREQLENITLTIDTLQLIGELMGEGLTAAQAVDFVAIEEVGYGQTEWADETGRSRQGVHGNYTKAKENLNE